MEELDPPNDCRVDVDERLHGGNQEGAAAASGVKKAQSRKNLVEQPLAEIGVEVQ